MVSVTSAPIVWICRQELPAARLLDQLPDSQRQALLGMKSQQALASRALAWHLRNALLQAHLPAAAGASFDFAKTTAGKPYLPAWPECQFNLSHTQGAVVAALASQSIGVDLELRAREANWSALAARQFSPAERADLAESGEADYAERCLRLWSAREAWAKACGLGLAGVGRQTGFSWQDGRWQPKQGVFWQYACPEHWLSLALMAEPGEVQTPRVYDVQFEESGGVYTPRLQTMELNLAGQTA